MSTPVASDSTGEKRISRPVRETPAQFRARHNLKLLSEVYRNHWELFVKGFALYLAACSAFIGAAASHSDNKPLSFFSGVAIIVGSIVAIGATFVAVSFMMKTKERVDNLCAITQFESFMTFDPINAVRLLRLIAFCILAAGAVQVLYVVGYFEFSFLKK